MADYHPIQQHRTLTYDEISQLARAGPDPTNEGDWFAQWLARTPVDDRPHSLRAFLTKAIDPDHSYYQSFAVADGTPIDYDHKDQDNPLNSIPRSLRFITIVLPDTPGRASQLVQHAIAKRTLCFLSSHAPDMERASVFECASWNPHEFGRNRGLMRFYKRDRQGKDWIFVGDSRNAFNSFSQKQSPFVAHIGGAMIMKSEKELRAPWAHWFDITNIDEFQRSLGSTPNDNSKADPNNVLHDPLFGGRRAFSLLGRAETLEVVVRSSVWRWYQSRFLLDFVNPTTDRPLSTIKTHIKQWMSHILLTQSMNIVASATSSARVRRGKGVVAVPITLFYNMNALHPLLPGAGGIIGLNLDNNFYMATIQKLGLSIHSDVSPAIGCYKDGLYDSCAGEYPAPRRQRLAIENTEGPFAFPIIEPGLEDYQAIRALLTSTPRLLTHKAIAAMLMVDFCNPIYSPRRESLMKYVPETADYDEETCRYDVLERFKDNVRKSPQSADPTSAEREILDLLDTPDESYVDVFSASVNRYLDAVRARLFNQKTAKEAIEDYMTLAEGRRQTYRKRENSRSETGGLDLFALTLPRATQPNPFPITRMTKDGLVKLASAGCESGN